MTIVKFLLTEPDNQTLCPILINIFYDIKEL